MRLFEVTKDIKSCYGYATESHIGRHNIAESDDTVVVEGNHNFPANVRRRQVLPGSPTSRQQISKTALPSGEA